MAFTEEELETIIEFLTEQRRLIQECLHQEIDRRDRQLARLDKIIGSVNEQKKAPH